MDITKFSYVDNAFIIKGFGILLEGWCYEFESRPISIHLEFNGMHYEANSSNFLRFFRQDTFEHLTQLGAKFEGDCMYGFFCLFPFHGEHEPRHVHVARAHQASVCLQVLILEKISYLDMLSIIFKKFEGAGLGYSTSNEVALFFNDAHASLVNNLKPVELQFGEPPQQPTTSIIVPCFPNMKLSELQLASFSNHITNQHAMDLIYVANYPGLDMDFAEYLFAVYKIPFRVLSMGDNFGYSIANNVASLRARTDDLLFMNSDVFTMDHSFDDFLHQTNTAPKNSVTGAKLYYPTGTTQHDGIFLQKVNTVRATRELDSFFVGNHFSKGLTDANSKFDNSALLGVTGAVFRINRDYFYSLGLFAMCYIMGDYEDIDFCTRVIETGGSILYRDDVHAIHAEGYAKNSLPAVYSLFQLHNRNMFNIFHKDNITTNPDRFKLKTA